MSYTIPIESGEFYHIFNRGINGENIFKEEDKYLLCFSYIWNITS